MNKTETKSSWSQADMDWSDGDQVVNFFNDGDSVDKFEDFRPEDLIDFNDGYNNILANLPISDFSPDKDRDFIDDIHNGWFICKHCPIHRRS